MGIDSLDEPPLHPEIPSETESPDPTEAQIVAPPVSVALEPITATISSLPTAVMSTAPIPVTSTVLSSPTPTVMLSSAPSPPVVVTSEAVTPVTFSPQNSMTGIHALAAAASATQKIKMVTSPAQTQSVRIVQNPRMISQPIRIIQPRETPPTTANTVCK